MRLRLLLLPLFLILWTAAPSSPSDSPAPLAIVPAVPLKESPSLAWVERQFVQADKQGRVFLLKGGTLELFALRPGGQLEPKGRLEDATDEGRERLIESAAMSLAGDVWVLFSKPNRLDVFQSGKRRESVDSPWMVSAVAAPAGDPIVSALPAVMDSATVGARPAAPPSLARWDGKRWSPMAEGSFGKRTRPEAGSPGAVEGVSLMEQMRGESSRLLAGAADGSLWVADRHAYRLRSFSPLGMAKGELRVGEGEVHWDERSAEEWRRAEKLARQEGLAFDRRSLSRVRATETLRALALGRDGAVYLLVQAEGGVALDRFSAAQLRLERVLLSGLDPLPPRLTLAAGQDGLYLAGPSGRLGLWRIAAEALERADWQPVAEADFDGRPLEP